MTTAVAICSLSFHMGSPVQGTHERTQSNGVLPIPCELQPRRPATPTESPRAVTWTPQEGGPILLPGSPDRPGRREAVSTEQRQPPGSSVRSPPPSGTRDCSLTISRGPARPEAHSKLTHKQHLLCGRDRGWPKVRGPSCQKRLVNFYQHCNAK